MTTTIGDVVLSESAVQQGVATVAALLNAQYQHSQNQSAVVITVVPGGILFTADLVRKLTFEIEMDYISCPHTPGDRQNQSEIVYHQNIAITNRDVILIDDAIESGGTMKRLVEHLQTFSPKSLAIATLFVKPGRVEIPVKQYYAYEMQNDDLLVGYGLPWQHKWRNLPFVAQLVKAGV
ncbi:phosphoribosyltransferase [Testudinibacter aquarius]|uniref:Hypoxanthine phosphoribosyltransferase n=1 Tax=Testudinibacter aquarius TaxID=1524974 RepID=A0A4R3Y0R1_9PAST|nr:phosphoribosyltransferase family protein [Testudinibacter aquarius]TCV84831.1 hypoxanthine phosphoribosyltransferase [Testudinibacter aquarius]